MARLTIVILLLVIIFGVYVFMMLRLRIVEDRQVTRRGAFRRDAALLQHLGHVLQRHGFCHRGGQGGKQALPTRVLLL